METPPADRPDDPAVIYALARTEPDFAQVAARRWTYLADTDREAQYWHRIAVDFYTQIATVHDAHVTHCVTDPCPTCTALSEAMVAYDGFEKAEATRCTCGGPHEDMPDHFTIHCVTRRPGDAQ